MKQGNTPITNKEQSVRAEKYAHTILAGEPSAIGSMPPPFAAETYTRSWADANPQISPCSLFGSVFFSAVFDFKRGLKLTHIHNKFISEEEYNWVMRSKGSKVHSSLRPRGKGKSITGGVIANKTISFLSGCKVLELGTRGVDLKSGIYAQVAKTLYKPQHTHTHTCCHTSLTELEEEPEMSSGHKALIPAAAVIENESSGDRVSA